MIEQFQSGKLDAQPGRTMMESFEHKVNEVLNKARDNAGKTAQSSLKYTNNVVRMVTAGSKGSFINISQVCTAGSQTALCAQMLLKSSCRCADIQGLVDLTVLCADDSLRGAAEC